MVRIPRFLKRVPRGPAEAVLWDHMDACGLPFRQSKSALIAQFGSYPTGWSQRLDLCEPVAAKPFIKDLAKPLNFKFHAESDLSAPPATWTGAVQASRDHRINYARAVAGMVALFGEGEVTSASNTVERRWQFGLARLACTVWLPENRDPDQRNPRHDMFPETETEAALTIEPAWRPALSAEGHALCAQAEPLPLAGNAPFCRWSALTRDWPKDLPHPGAGICHVPGVALMRIWEGPYLDGLALDWVTGVQLDKITKGRRGPSCKLSVSYHPMGETQTPKRRLVLAQAKDAQSLDKSAAQLAHLLGCDLKVSEAASD